MAPVRIDATNCLHYVYQVIYLKIFPTGCSHNDFKNLKKSNYIPTFFVAATTIRGPLTQANTWLL
jgi:hypothetical protein